MFGSLLAGYGEEEVRFFFFFSKGEGRGGRAGCGLEGLADCVWCSRKVEGYETAYSSYYENIGLLNQSMELELR